MSREKLIEMTRSLVEHGKADTMELADEVVEDIFCNATLEWLNLEKSKFE